MRLVMESMSEFAYSGFTGCAEAVLMHVFMCASSTNLIRLFAA